MRKMISHPAPWIARFYTLTLNLYEVAFDEDRIYYSRKGKQGTVDLENVIEVRPGVWPFRIFMSNVYLLTIVYNEGGSRRRLRFLSRGARGPAGTADGIPLLDLLRQAIRRKKYGL